MSKIGITLKKLNEMGKDGKPIRYDLYVQWGTGMARMKYAVVLKWFSNYHVVTYEAMQKWMRDAAVIVAYGERGKDYKSFKTASGVYNYLSKYTEKL